MIRKTITVASAVLMGAALGTSAASASAPPPLTGATHVGSPFPATGATSASGAQMLSVGGRRYLIPDVALPFLGRGLNLDLFDTGLLAARERNGRLPVRVTYRGRVPSLPGITITGSGHGIARGYLTAASAQRFGATLARQFAADHDRAGYGTDGIFSHGTRISLDGPEPSAPARAMAPTYTLTIRGTNLAGRPDTGDVAAMMSVDQNTQTTQPSIAVFSKGVATFHNVPAGHYFALGEFDQIGAPNPVIATRLVVLPQFTVTGNTTETMHATAARPVTITTPRPATMVDTDLWLMRTVKSGPPIVLEDHSIGHRLWISPTQAKPTVGTIQVSVNEHLQSPPGPGVPYEYTLSYTSPPGTIPLQHYVAQARDLATVHERFYQAVKSSGYFSFNGAFPGTDPNNNADWFGFIEPVAIGPYRFPGELTEYAGGTGSAAVAWHAQYLPLGAEWQQGDSRQLRPGEQITDDWGAGPLHPGPNVLLNTEPDMFGGTVPSAVRFGNSLQLMLDPFDDNQPGHNLMYLPLPQITGTFQVDANGRKIAGGSVAQHTSYGEIFDQAVLGSGTATIRFALSMHRANPDYPLSTATTTVWTWHSAVPAGVRLPAGWSCAIAEHNRDCAIQPMMTLLYSVAGLNLNETTAPGRQVVDISAGHLQGAPASAITEAKVWVSVDGGKTWHQATVTGRDGHYAAAFTAPAGSKVSLRTSAADSAGDTITETITDAYQVRS